MQARPEKEGPRVNEDIDNAQIRLVDADGEMIGVVPTEEALDRAADAGLDLVEVSPNADPPVCKILDFGKLKYENQKKKAEARKKQKTIDVKEIKMRPGIEEHDYQVKMRSMRRFIDDGDKVKVTLRFRGREMAHQDLGAKVLDRVRDDMDELAKVEQFPQLEGRQMTMVFAPR
ncbi:MAG: translation initiation factor IF-3 [Rhodospirillales bacterium]|nr:translation initiation factor IF-3 [Rhodospirillales bacterium]